MANLAIKGHATRGNEVIELLEMLGGKNCFYYDGTFKGLIYTIGSKSELDVFNINSPSVDDGYIVFTIEEFIEKYPYKVGDKVKTSLHFANCIGTVKRMRWEQNENVIIYDVEWSDANKSTLTYYAQGLRPYKEQETMDKANKAVFDVNAQCCDIMNHLIKEETMEDQIKIDIPKGYEFAGVDDDKQQVVFEKIVCQYPKDFKECCEVLSLGENGKLYTKGYKASLIQDFHKLIICRNSYWKMAGEQMGLGKPWEPEKAETVYAIFYNFYDDVIDVSVFNLYDNVILCFPTEEIRDKFFENFNDLINKCKELL